MSDDDILPSRTTRIIVPPGTGPAATIFEMSVPAGELEITHAETRYTTKLVLDLPDRSLDEVRNQTKRYTLTRPQVLQFVEMNTPSNGQVWEAYIDTEFSTEFHGQIPGWQTQKWDFGEGGRATFRFRYEPPNLNRSGRPVLVGLSSVSIPSDWQGRSNGFASIAYCGNDPESWVRGRADLDRDTGLVSMLLQLETDSVRSGPRGKLTVYFKDSAGNLVGTASGEGETGGKTPGKARVDNVFGTATIPVDAARKTEGIEVRAECTGSLGRLFNIKLSDFLEFVTVAVSIIG